MHKMNNKELQPIAYGRIPDILLMGNGINISFGGSSWSRVLSGISTGEFDYDHYSIQQLPYALQTIVISSDSVSDGMRDIADRLMPQPLGNEHSALLGDFLTLPFETVLTTNYSYEIEVALKKDFDLKIGRPSGYRLSSKKGNNNQEQFGVFKYIRVGELPIWHIHGEAARPKSMVMGHYYYGKLLGEIQKRVPEVIRGYKMAQKRREAYHPQSWIDYFLIGNVHIVGFGLDPSEMDIWWLINCKKRNFSDCGKIYFYEPNMDEPKKYALKALTDIFGIQCYSKKIKKNGYKGFYKDSVDEIKRIIS